MINVEVSVVINRPVEEVFVYLTDTKYQPQLDSRLVEVRRMPEGPMGIGTRVTEVHNFLGRKMESASEVVEYEPNARYALKGVAGPFSGIGYRIFQPLAAGTHVTWRFELQPSGLLALAGPLVTRLLKRSLDTELGAAKALIENGAITDPS